MTIPYSRSVVELINMSTTYSHNVKVNEEAETNLLEADVHVKGEGLPRVAHRGYAELPIG